MRNGGGAVPASQYYAISPFWAVGIHRVDVAEHTVACNLYGSPVLLNDSHLVGRQILQQEDHRRGVMHDGDGAVGGAPRRLVRAVATLA